MPRAPAAALAVGKSSSAQKSSIIFTLSFSFSKSFLVWKKKFKKNKKK